MRKSRFCKNRAGFSRNVNFKNVTERSLKDTKRIDRVHLRERESIDRPNKPCSKVIAPEKQNCVEENPLTRHTKDAEVLNHQTTRIKFIQYALNELH